jgi:hypothetical protein
MVLEYPNTKRPNILWKLEQLSKDGKEVIVLKSSKEVQHFLEKF